MSSPPTLSSAPAAIETGSTADPVSSQGLAETAFVVQGTPTEVYALVARGALGCWFGANGALKATHVFHAEAAPPSQGGQAGIVLHERDPSLRDQRGSRALQVKFASDAAGVRVGVTVVRIAPIPAELMVQEISEWARGGRGCRAAASQPSPQAAAPMQSSAKTRASRASAR